MPSTSSTRSGPTGLALVTRLLAVVGSITLLSTVASAQTGELLREYGLLPTTGIRLIGGLLANLVVAGLLVGLAPTFARERVRDLRDDPVSGFGWGLITGIGVPIVLTLLAITIIGLLIAVPGFLLLIVVGIAGNGVTVLWVGSLVCREVDALGDHPLLVGSVATAVVGAVPFLGDFALSVLTFFGLGAVGKAVYDSYRD